MKLPEGLTLDAVMDAAQGADCIGFCLMCGNEQCGCEPDARNYECESCGLYEVFGAQEILIMVV